MGTLLLDCPLCCGKTFPCQKTLKRHLLSLADDISCPECSLKFNSIRSFAEHLGDNCEQNKRPKEISNIASTRTAALSYCDTCDSKVNEIEKSKSDIYNNLKNNLNLFEDDEIQGNQAVSGLDGNKLNSEDIKGMHRNCKQSEIDRLKESKMENEIVSVQVLKQEDFSEQLQVRLLKAAEDGSIVILTDGHHDTLHQDAEIIETENELVTINSVDGEIADVNLEEDEQMEGMYSCNSCGISFTSVIEHIKLYHNEQEVVVEMEDNGLLDESLHEVAVLEVAPDDNSEGLDEICKDENIEDEQTETVNETKRILLETGDIVSTTQGEIQGTVSIGERWRTPQILNTLREEQCVDRDGRWYTRKVVQIERFWDTTDVKTEITNDGFPLDDENVKGEDILDTDDVNGEEASTEAYLDDQGEDLEDDNPNISRIYHCTHCCTQYLTMPDFENHICNPQQGKYKCDHCSVSYNNSKSLCAHMKVHKGLKVNEKRMTTKNEGYNEDDTSRLVGPFKCAVCDTVFPSNKSLRLHRRMHEPVRARPVEAPVEYAAGASVAERFHCALCDKWIHVGYRRIHEAVHTGDTEYNCDICNRKFHTKDNLAMHMNVHNTEKITSVKSDKLLPYECNYCNRQFARPHEKVKHERIHTGEKPHSCDICGKSFRVSYCLTLHMRTHTGARPYVCQHCGKRFKAHSVYNHHLLTHSDVRAYKCPYCPKAFKTSVQLAGHKNSHTKPFSCTECNRPFASLYAVRVHMETHKRQNNLKFNCQYCGASYARAFALRDHLKAQHFIAEFDKDSEPDVNAAALSIIPKMEGNVEMDKLVMADSDGEIEINTE